MPLTTEVFKYAGVDLRSMGLYMSLVDGMLSSPPLRGSNVLIPYQPGQRWVQKYYDQRHVVLAGELISVVSRADFQAKIDSLKALFPIGAGEQKLEIQRADGSFRYVMAEVINTMGLQWQLFPTRSSAYSIELVASDPLWYGSVLEAGVARGPWAFDSGIFFDDGAHWFDTTAISFAQLLTANITNLEATNSGTIYTRKPIFTIQGPVPVLNISNLRNNYQLQVQVAIGATDTAVIDCGLQSLTINGVVQSPSKIALGSVVAQTDWMHLEPGENTLSVKLGGYTTPVTYNAIYSPAYL